MHTSKLFAGAMLLAVVAFVLNGCGGDKTAGGGDTLENVKKAGVLKWGADASGGAPFVYNDPNDPNKIIGFEVDMMEKIAEHMGVKQERVHAEWSKLLDELNNKKSDFVINGYEINDRNKKKATPSQPYFIYEQQLSVRAEDKDKYKKLDDLKGQKIGILEGTESQNVLTAAGFKEDQIVNHPDSKTPYDNLNLKRVEAVLAEWMIADYYAGPKGPVKGIHNIPETFAPGKYAVWVRTEKSSDALLAEINRVIKLMSENGELAAIYKKWNIWNDKQKELGIVAK